MVTDKQNKKNKTTKKEKQRRVIGGAKFLSKYMSGLAPSKEDVYRRSYSESKIASSMTESFPRAKLRQIWLRVFSRANCVKYDWEFSESKTSSSMTESFLRANCVKYDWEFFKSQLRQIWLLIFSRHLSLKSLLAPSSWDRFDDPQLAEVVLKPTYCWSCYVADVRERAADQITK